MSKQAVVVTYRVKPGRIDELMPLLRAHIARTKANEPGCLQFDVLVPTDGSDRVFLYEVYADQAAIDAHMATAHMAQYREDTDPMIAERIRTACAVVND